MSNSNYRNGVALERRVIKDLRSKGLEGLRTAGSHGVADIVAYHPRSLTDGLVDILRPQEMVQLVLDGWQRLHDDKILGDFLYGGMRVAPSGKGGLVQADGGEWIHLPSLLTALQRGRGGKG